MRRYLLAIAAGNLVWETAQLPLYTLWRDGSAGSIIRSVLHCTAGDIAIGCIALVLALALAGDARWPEQRAHAVTLAVLPIGVSYTVWSEYQNTIVRDAWAYTEAMPVLPGVGTGLTPLLQWIAVPILALWFARRPATRSRGIGP